MNYYCSNLQIVDTDQKQDNIMCTINEQVKPKQSSRDQSLETQTEREDILDYWQ